MDASTACKTRANTVSGTVRIIYEQTDQRGGGGDAELEMENSVWRT